MVLGHQDATGGQPGPQSAGLQEVEQTVQVDDVGAQVADRAQRAMWALSRACEGARLRGNAGPGLT